jgi:hypothetical protein
MLNAALKGRNILTTREIRSPLQGLIGFRNHVYPGQRPRCYTHLAFNLSQPRKRRRDVAVGG